MALDVIGRGVQRQYRARASARTMRDSPSVSTIAAARGRRSPDQAMPIRHPDSVDVLPVLVLEHTASKVKNARNSSTQMPYDGAAAPPARTRTAGSGQVARRPARTAPASACPAATARASRPSAPRRPWPPSSRRSAGPAAPTAGSASRRSGTPCCSSRPDGSGRDRTTSDSCRSSPHPWRALPATDPAAPCRTTSSPIAAGMCVDHRVADSWRR